jgi:hypothetical protein
MRGIDVSSKSPFCCELSWGYSAQELHELVADLGRGFVLYPVAHIVELETPDEAGEAGAELSDWRIQYP